MGCVINELQHCVTMVGLKLWGEGASGGNVTDEERIALIPKPFRPKFLGKIANFGQITLPATILGQFRPAYAISPSLRPQSTLNHSFQAP
jgi:hypothetical protein